jgi:hypothetical protein
MHDRNTQDLIRAFAPRLNSEFQLEHSVPLEIKLRLEKLRLREMLEQMRCTGLPCCEVEEMMLAS